MVGTFIAHLEQKLDPNRFWGFSTFFPFFFSIWTKQFLYHAQNDKKTFFSRL